MKKLLSIILSLALLVSAMALMISCGEETPDSPCTEHVDSDSNGKCDNCDADVSAPGANNGKVSVEFTVADDEGDTLEGITVMLMLANVDDAEIIQGTSGAGGKLTLSLATGKYSVMYDYDIDAIGYYFGDTTSVTVTADTTSIELKMIDNNPDGSADKPYTLSVGDNELVIPAGASYTYIVYRAVNLFVDFEGSGIKITYGEETYTPDENGKISIKLLGVDTNSVETLVIENTTDAEATYNIAVNSAPGTSGNPYVIETLGEEIRLAVATGDTVYYSYTATADGVFTITLVDNKTSVSIMNTRNSVTVNSANDAADGKIVITVKAGDEIVIDCSTTASGDTVEIAFIPELK